MDLTLSNYELLIKGPFEEFFSLGKAGILGKVLGMARLPGPPLASGLIMISSYHNLFLCIIENVCVYIL